MLHYFSGDPFKFAHDQRNRVLKPQQNAAFTAARQAAGQAYANVQKDNLYRSHSNEAGFLQKAYDQEERRIATSRRSAVSTVEINQTLEQMRPGQSRQQERIMSYIEMLRKINGHTVKS